MPKALCNEHAAAIWCCRSSVAKTCSRSCKNILTQLLLLLQQLVVVVVTCNCCSS
jgi:hypothetical protein